VDSFIEVRCCGPSVDAYQLVDDLIAAGAALEWPVTPERHGVPDAWVDYTVDVVGDFSPSLLKAIGRRFTARVDSAWITVEGESIVASS
jgi:hypothetical protein